MFYKKLFLFVLPFFLFADANYYIIKLAAYKNLDSLHHAIKKLPSHLQETVNITHTDAIYRALLQPSTDKAYLQKQLPDYQHVFQDAFITTVSTEENPTLSIQKTILQSPTSQTTTKQEKKVVLSSLKKPSSLHEKFKGKTFYMSARKSKQMKQNILFRVDFQDHTATYTPLQGLLPSAKLSYKVLNGKLYVYKNGMYNPSIYSKLEKETSEYFLVSGWMKTHKTSTMRYYFEETNAKQYLN